MCCFLEIELWWVFVSIGFVLVVVLVCVIMVVGMVVFGRVMLICLE